ncbi:MAG TPA: phosphate ABC transporter substrate-binding protein PstS [Terracidiphilus sp.]|nr:phosphate ABC transporter substrate-binding protein PstS [Terracidiphilus sp.]
MRNVHARVLRRAGWAAGLLAVVFAAAQSPAANVSESGSTLIYPLFNTWITAYAKAQPGVHITAAATGSGAGIADAISGRVQIGTSDAYMSDDQQMAHPHILNIPLAISAQTVDANLPELRGRTLKLSGPVLAGIYTGKIRMWDDGQIAAINQGVQLPHHEIVPVRRAEGSGDTFIFTQFLSFSDQSGPDPDSNPTLWENKIGYGTSVSWPSVSGELSATGNSGMVATIARTPYAVGYVGASYEAGAAKDNLIVAMIENQAGKFLLPTRETVTAAASALTPRTPSDERLTLVFAPGDDSYPLINYEYAMVADHQSNAQTAAAVSNFLLWCISPEGGNSAAYLDPLHFMALPISIRAKSEIQIAKIQ